MHARQTGVQQGLRLFGSVRPLVFAVRLRVRCVRTSWRREYEGGEEVNRQQPGACLPPSGRRPMSAVALAPSAPRTATCADLSWASGISGARARSRERGDARSKLAGEVWLANGRWGWGDAAETETGIIPPHSRGWVRNAAASPTQRVDTLCSLLTASHRPACGMDWRTLLQK